MLRIVLGVIAGFIAWMVLWVGIEKIISAIWPAFGAHQRAFEEVVNALLGVEKLLEIGYGQLANGPVTLLRRYAEVAEAPGVDTRLTVTGPGRNGLCVLELGETYVVAERFTIT